jgi:adenylate cyclase
MKLRWVTLGILLAIFLLTVSIYLLKVPPFYSLSLKVTDINYKLNRNKISEKILLVLVDEKSVNKFGRWPWDRKLIAEGLKKLKSAKVIALDMVFSEPSVPHSDAYLANTIAELGNVVCGFFVRKQATQNPPDEVIDILTDSALFRLPEKLPFPTIDYAEVNIPEVTESCLLSGVFNAIADQDQNFRRYPTSFIFKGNVYPSLGVQAIRAFLEKDAEFKKDRFLIGNLTIPVEEGGLARLNFYKLPEYKKISISFSDLFSSNFSEDLVKNKIVVFGISEAGITDIRSTPIGLVPGPYLHVTFISNTLKGELLKESKFAGIILNFLVFLFLVFIYFKFQPENRFWFYAVLVLFVFFVSRYLYLQHLVVHDFYAYLNIILSAISLETIDSIAKHKQASFIKRAFSTYISPELLNEIMKDPSKLNLGGEKREITVLFSDIRGFTSISETLQPEKLVDMLNTYLTPMTEIVLKNKGMLDKYIGDAIMALWNVPLEVPEHRLMGILTGLEMLRVLQRVNKTLKQKGLPEISIGIGINTGIAVVGNMGSEKRFEYTAIGDTVNLASRLEGLNKVYFKNSSGLIISEYTALGVEPRSFILLELDKVRVKGKEIPVRIFTALEEDSANMELKMTYEEALQLYRKGKFKEAEKIFSEIKAFPPAQEFVKRCQEFESINLESWDGVYTLKTK